MAMGEAGTGTFYDALATHPEATPSQIRQAYRKAALRWHPDKVHPADKELAQRRFQEVAQAYEVLSDGRQRRIYDLYLRCRPYGCLEVVNPEDPLGPGLEVPFANWDEFSRLFSSGQLQTGDWMGEDSARYEENPSDGSDAPISVWEWLIAGGVVLSLWCVAVWRHEHNVWLKEMPARIFTMHAEYAAPMGTLLAPIFFGTVPFKEAVGWMNAVVEAAESMDEY
eukprot:gb/GFBE01005919.1/.p1 GENE.gb/GFBE01005919.1/~~gb/GFBE01005919.1/.p1  ORF type:complete len:224 (+),score=43.74 gb/GFBE01005919.1/:1-672(+)